MFSFQTYLSSLVLFQLFEFLELVLREQVCFSRIGQTGPMLIKSYLMGALMAPGFLINQAAPSPQSDK